MRAIMGGIANDDRIDAFDPLMTFIPIFLLLIDLYIYDTPIRL